MTNEEVLYVLKNIIENNNHQSEEFKAGMNYVLQNFKEYIIPPSLPFMLSTDFKEFALNAFLNNDNEKLPIFEKLIELFTIKMKQLNRYSTWGVYPEELDYEIASILIECFDGINFTTDTDYDRQGVTIDLTVNVKKDNKMSRISIGDYQTMHDNGFMPNKNDDNDGNNDDLDALNGYLNEECHYETLLLYVCLKKFYEYINPQKVELLLEEAKS